MTTKADLARFRALQQIGCIACRQPGRVLAGGRPPLAIRWAQARAISTRSRFVRWHHRGQPPDGITVAEANRYYGPSLARAPKSFRAEFGDDETLLATVDALLERVT